MAVRNSWTCIRCDHIGTIGSCTNCGRHEYRRSDSSYSIECRRCGEWISLCYCLQCGARTDMKTVFGQWDKRTGCLGSGIPFGGVLGGCLVLFLMYMILAFFNGVFNWGL